MEARGSLNPSPPPWQFTRMQKYQKLMVNARLGDVNTLISGRPWHEYPPNRAASVDSSFSPAFEE